MLVVMSLMILLEMKLGHNQHNKLISKAYHLWCHRQIKKKKMMIRILIILVIAQVVIRNFQRMGKTQIIKMDGKAISQAMKI